MTAYLDANAEYWKKGYDAPNVDRPVFLFYGRVLKPDFSLYGNGERLFDFGCGRGAAVDFFNRCGFHARGADISPSDIDAARIRYPLIADRFDLCDSNPAKVPYYGFNEGVQVVTAIQSLYYLSDSDFEICMEKIYASMNKGGVFYATMMGEQASEFFDNSTPADDGLRCVEFKNDRIDISNYYISFIKDEDAMVKKFNMFKPHHVGYYCSKIRSDEGDTFHFTFCGIKE